MNEGQNNEVKSAPAKLTDITRGLYHAASSTYAMVANQYINLLAQYFDEKADGSFVPKTAVVQLPDETVINLPLISLVAPKGLALDKVNFDFSVNLEPDALMEATTQMDELNLTRSSFKAELAAKNNQEEGSRKPGMVDISMEFRVNEPPEGIMRLLDKFAALVTPVKPSAETVQFVPMLSQKFQMIAQVLEDTMNTAVAKIMIDFSPEFSAGKFKERADRIKVWEDELLQRSVAVDNAKASFAPVFKETLQAARIAFMDTPYADKLNMAIKSNMPVSEWVPEVIHFYKILLADQEYALIFGRLKDPEAKPEHFKEEWEKELKKVMEISELLDKYQEQKNKPEAREAEEWLKKFNTVAKLRFKENPAQLRQLFPDTEFFRK